MHIEKYVPPDGDEPAEQIKKEEFHIADRGLDVVSKNPEEQHVAKQVHKIAVQEHGSEQGIKMLASCYFDRYRAEHVPEWFYLPFGQHSLEHKYSNINYYETIAEQREEASFYLVVTNGEYHSLFIWPIIKL